MLRGGFLDLHTARGPRRIRRTDLKGIEAMLISHSSRVRTPVPEMNRDHVVWLPGGDPRRHGVFDSSSLMSDLDRVDVNVAALFADSFFESQLLGSVWTNQRGIVPGHFRQRLRQLLQPTVVCKATIVNCRIGSED